MKQPNPLIVYQVCCNVIYRYRNYLLVIYYKSWLLQHICESAWTHLEILHSPWPFLDAKDLRTELALHS